MCGNVTLMGRLLAGESSALPARARELLLGMLRVSQMRGAQSGGGAVQIRKGSAPAQIVRKCVNPKRGDLGALLASRLGQGARSKRAFGGTFLVQSHVRYATSGLTSEHEAHPFRFVDEKERGPRRVHQWLGDRPSLVVRPIETALTHNGDMDGMRWRGTLIPRSDLGAFLERILGVRNRWTGDSPLLAGAIELHLTRGMWLESLRLAFQLVVAPPPADPAHIPAELEGQRRDAAVRQLFAGHPALSWELLRRWEAIAESVYAEHAVAFVGAALLDAPAQRRHREALAASLAARFDERSCPEIPPGRALAFARAAVNAFFDNDLYIALRKLEPALEGTFGCVVTSTLEPGSLVAFARGQPLSLGFQRESGLVGVVSERAALKLRAGSGAAVFAERLDLDLCRGEIARVSLEGDRPVSLTLYGIADGSEYRAEELVAAGRLVPLWQNPYVLELPPSFRDRTEGDLQAITPLLANIRASFQDPASANRQTAQAFAEALLGRERPRLLVVGITNDLWLSEQFVQNLRVAFPGIVAEAKSSNEVLREAGTQPFDADTVVLAVSQSGQDFPTLGALVWLLHRAGVEGKGAFFVLSGELDSLMAQAVGQSCARGAPFTRRIFANLSGFRPSEAAIATVSATHHSFVELFLFLVERALDPSTFATPPHGLLLERQDLDALRRRRDLVVDRHAPAIAGNFAVGPAAEVSRELARRSRRWVRHLLEGALAFVVAVLVLEANLQAGLRLTPSRALSWIFELFPAAPAAVASGLRLAAGQIDVVFYAFLAPLALWLLRALQGRPLLHRQGTRELLIGDTRYVHQIVWLFARKLFSLSYGFASIKPYSADCQDELVMTHEPLRGTLALFGVPDGRRAGLRARAAAALMTAKQFSYSRSVGGTGAEVVTLSHAPRAPGNAFGVHVTLPGAELGPASPRAELLIEGLFDSWERLLGMQVFLDRLARGASRLPFFRYDRSRTKDQVFAPTTASPVSAAEVYQLLARTSERYAGDREAALPFEVVRSEWRGSAPPVRTTLWRTDAGGPGGVEPGA